MRSNILKTCWTVHQQVNDGGNCEETVGNQEIVKDSAVLTLKRSNGDTNCPLKSVIMRVYVKDPEGMQ